MNANLNNQTIRLYGFIDVCLDFFQALREEALERISTLKESPDNITAEKLSPPGFWNELTANDRRLVGLCFSFMVKLSLLPLVKLKIKKDNRNQYRFANA